MGYTRVGLKPGLHPLLAVIAGVPVLVQLWLRPGNASCGSNVTACSLDLWDNLSWQVRLRGVRADGSFCLPELLSLREGLGLPYVVVAQLSRPNLPGSKPIYDVRSVPQFISRSAGWGVILWRRQNFLT